MRNLRISTSGEGLLAVFFLFASLPVAAAISPIAYFGRGKMWGRYLLIPSAFLALFFFGLGVQLAIEAPFSRDTPAWWYALPFAPAAVVVWGYVAWVRARK